MKTLPTGLAFRGVETTSRWLSSRRFTGASLLGETVLQPLAVLHDQRRRPSCVGQSHAQGIESVTGQRVSAVDLWELARILQGEAAEVDQGTRSEYAIDALERRGWEDYVPGEDARPTEADGDGRVGSSLAAAMKAHGRRGRVVLHQTIDTTLPRDDVAAQVVAALRLPRHYVVFGSGTREGYFDPPADTVLGTDRRGGTEGGHAERVSGWIAERSAFLIEGSWGAWSWCRLPDGSVARGHVLVAPDVLAAAREIDVIEVLP